MTAGVLAALAPALAQSALPSTSGAAEFWVFWLVAPLSLAAAISVVVLRNPVHAALMLVVNFFTFAIFYAVLQAQFLATIQVIVYAGAIVILFLFVLMLLGVDRDAESGPGRLRGQKLAAILLGLGLFIGLTATVAGPYMGTDSACNASAPVQAAIEDAAAGARPCVGLEVANSADGGNVAQIGRSLFTDYVWPFEVTSVLLVIAAIGAMVLGRRSEPLTELVDVGTADAPGTTRTPVAVAAGEDPAPGGQLEEPTTGEETP